MKVTIDPGRCEGHGRCYMLAPDVFEPDDIGNGHPMSEHLDPEQLDRAKQAVRNCPEGAITLHED